jgi:DNA-binding transcriptional ArsR family regulator
MLLRLMDGCGHSARDLATAAGVSASAASAHLRHLTEAELITVTVVGRTRQHAIASPEVAAAIEALAAISPLLPVESLRQATSGSQLRTARACYSHLGGELAVAVSDHLADAGAITPPHAASAGELHHLDAPLLTALRITDLKPGSGPSVRGCLDWTERRPHLAGRLGTVIMRAMLNNGWLTRRPSNRALTITNLGAEQLIQLGIDPASPASPLPMLLDEPDAPYFASLSRPDRSIYGAGRGRTPAQIGNLLSTRSNRSSVMERWLIVWAERAD